MRNWLDKIFKGDKVIWTVYFFLAIVSLVEVYSAANTLTFKSGNHWAPIISHGTHFILGFLVLWLCHAIPYKMYKAVPLILWPLSVILLVVVFFIGSSENDAARWIPIFGFQFQPSELAKLTVIIFTALFLARMQDERMAKPDAIKLITIGAGAICALILPENLSTAGLLFIVVMCMMFIGRVPLKQLGKLTLMLCCIGVVLLAIIFVIPDDTPQEEPGQEMTEQAAPKKKSGLFHRAITWKHRIADHFTDNDSTYDSSLRGENAQVICAHTAIATSNILGKIPGNSELCDLLPQPYSDFIYAIIVEEIGLAGGFAVLFLYIILLFRAGRIAGRCTERFPALLIMGLAIMMVSQALVNMCVVVGIIPVTGQPLPLISRGGSAIVFNSAYIGIMLSISRSVMAKDKNRDVSIEPEEESGDSTAAETDDEEETVTEAETE